MELFRRIPNGTEEILFERKCPSCGSTRTHRSHPRKGFERVLRAVTPFRPFSCSACRWRGWRIPHGDAGPILPPIQGAPSKRQELVRTPAAKANRRRRIVFAIVTSVVVGLTTLYALW